jgi:hexaprenyl-diphosphate synthase
MVVLGSVEHQYPSNARGILVALGGPGHHGAFAQPPSCPQSPLTSLSTSSTSTSAKTDPYILLAPHLDQLRISLGSFKASLNATAQYYFLHSSKQLRPLLVLLFARATNGLGQGFPEVSGLQTM